jgi:hypothetical protein
MVYTHTAYFVLIEGTAPVGGNHAGRLAVEQLYGYMIHNQVQLGIISTLFGWVFLRRQDQGNLFMTPMFGCRPEIGGEYTVPQGFTILQALYYFSHLAEDLPPLPETTGGQPGYIHIDRAAVDTAAPAPTIQFKQDWAFVPFNPGQPGTQPRGQQFTLTTPRDSFDLIFESWNHEKRLGEKIWRCTLLPTDDIVIKIWDSYKYDSTARDREVVAYRKLQTLWGKVIPIFIASAPISIFHGLILNYINVGTFAVKAKI